MYIICGLLNSMKFFFAITHVYILRIDSHSHALVKPLFRIHCSFKSVARRHLRCEGNCDCDCDFSFFWFDVGPRFFFCEECHLQTAGIVYGRGLCCGGFGRCLACGLPRLIDDTGVVEEALLVLLDRGCSMFLPLTFHV